VVLTTANFGAFSNFCRYYARSQTGKSTGYRPALKPLEQTSLLCYIQLKVHWNIYNAKTMYTALVTSMHRGVPAGSESYP
jgi:hypothetical protein